MSKVICSPGCYIQGNGELKKLADYCAKAGANKAYLLIDKFIYDTYKDNIESSFKVKCLRYTMEIFGGECSEKEIRKHQNALGQSDIVIGIGGGKTLDTAKAISFYSNIPVIIVPTAASTDAPCSRLSVIYTDQGTFDHYLPLNKNPDMVIMDTEVIAKAPVRFLMAGIGDALATYYEAAACEQSDAVTMAGGHITKAAITLAKLCVPFPVSWTVKMKKKQKETQDILSYHTQAAGCSDKARAKASGGRQPIEECGRTGL